MLSCLRCQFKFGADAIRASHEYRFPIPFRNLEQGAKPAYPGENALSCRAARERFDVLHEALTGIDVNAGIPVGKLFALLVGFQVAIGFQVEWMSASR